MGIDYEPIRGRKRWDAVSTWKELSGLKKMNPQVLEIKKGQMLENANEPKGGLQVVIGLSDRLAVEGRLFKKEFGANGRRIPMADMRIQKYFKTKIPLYLEVADDAEVVDGSAYDWQW